MPRGDSHNRDVYITTQDEHGYTVIYRVETREIWFCYYCHYGPMTTVLHEHCADCSRRRSRHSRVETTEPVYHFVRYA